MRGQVMRLAQQVRHREADIEGWIAVVNHLVVEQDELVVVNEDVLRTVIAMHERDTPLTRLIDEPSHKLGRLGYLLRRKQVVRLQSQRFKEARVAERGI